VEQQREEFARKAQETTNFSALCREYDITRRTGYKWLERAKQGEPLADRSHVPHRTPGKTPPEIESRVLAVREAHPAWGGKKIRKVLENQGVGGLPCVKTCNNILKRNGCISEEVSRRNKPIQRFERERCNELWQTDFKGDFALSGGGRCFPLTILDDHSRFLLAVESKPGIGGVVESFREVFKQFGLPASVLSDNGPTFRGFQGGFAQFERWLMEHDVLPIHGRIRHPQTQGKVERLHGTMEAELLADKDFSDLQEAQAAFDPWRWDYNFIRPHEAIDMRCPGEVYVKSERLFSDDVTPFEYSGEHRVVKINNWGYVRFAAFQVFLSETLANQFVEFREFVNPLGDSPSWIACFRNFRIAQFDTQTGKLLNRSIRRL